MNVPYVGSHRVSITQLQNTIRRLRHAPASFTLPASGWTDGSGVTNYPYYYDMSVTGMTANDFVVVAIAPDSQGTAIACGLCATNETRAGAIRFYSAKVPVAAITGNYWILETTSAASA